MRPALFALGIASLTLACLACERDVPTRVEFFDDDVHEFSWLERRTIREIATSVAQEARHYLPALPARLYIRVHPGTPDTVNEFTGETGSASSPDTVVWWMDTTRPGGVTAIAEHELRAALFHEFHHLVRDATIPRTRMLDLAVAEGMATVFERDYASAAAPWGWYPAEVAAWLDELRPVPNDPEVRDKWRARHPDGRRWIAIKVGAYLVDRAVRATGKSPAELVSIPTDDILAMSERP